MTLHGRRTTFFVWRRVLGISMGMRNGGIVESWDGRANCVYLVRDGGCIHGYLLMVGGRVKMKTRTMG